MLHRHNMKYDNLDDYNWLADEVDLHEMPQALALGRLVIDKFGKKSVIDIGCSSGIYLVPFKDAGCEYYGIDGASGVGKWCKPNFEVVDFRHEWHPPRQWEMSYCIEVAEHVPPEFADNLVRIITECAPLCVFSAAKPGQGGEGHCNEQPRQYWIGKFEARGFVLDQGLTDALLCTINTDPVYDHCRWLRWNTMVLRKK